MSRPHDGHSMFSAFGNPFRMGVSKRSSHLSTKLRQISNVFESALTERLKQLKPSDRMDLLNLTWMQQAMEVLSATLKDLKSLITDLKFPATDWDEKWMNEYLDDTIKLLDICIALNGQISKHEEGQLLVHYVLHMLDFGGGVPSSDRLFRAKGSLQDLMEETESKRKNGVISLRDSKIENCNLILQGLRRSLQLGKAKSSAKGKVFLGAMYGLKATTIFVCSVLASALSGSPSPLMDLQIPDQFSWSVPFLSVQQEVNEKIRSAFAKGRVTVLKELESLDVAIKTVHSGIEKVVPEGTEVEQMKNAIQELQQSAQLLAQGLDSLTKQVNEFFQIVLNGRNVLLDSLRLSGNQEIPNGDDLPHE